MDYQALRDYIDSDLAFVDMIAAGDDEGIAQEINSRTIDVVGKVTAHDIRQYLMLVDLLLPIEESTSPSCKAAARALDIFPIFDLSNPMIEFKLGQVLDGLVADDLIPDFTETHKLTILSFATTPQPVFGQMLTNSDIAKAFGRMGI